MTLPLGLTLTAAIVALSWIFGEGVQGVLTLVLYVLGVSPGLSLGRALFGKNGVGMASGALIGYALLVFAFWLPIELGAPGPVAFGHARA